MRQILLVLTVLAVIGVLWLGDALGADVPELDP